MADKTPSLPDLADRMTALTAVDRSLLVEAGAGSGKTSIMAGRVAVLLCRRHRAEAYRRHHLHRVRGQRAPDPYRSVRPGARERHRARRSHHAHFPDGVSSGQQKHLEDASGRARPVDLHDHPRLRPGADQALSGRRRDRSRRRHRRSGRGGSRLCRAPDAWLKERLSTAAEDGIIAQLILCDEAKGLTLVREVAQFLQRQSGREAGRRSLEDVPGC